MTDHPDKSDPTSELVERELARFADPDGRIPMPLIDQRGKRIGVARRTPAELMRVDAFVDERGTAWMPPTAWAYFAVCKARDEAADTISQLHQQAEAMATALERCATIVDRNLYRQREKVEDVPRIARQAIALYRKGQPDAE